MSLRGRGRGVRDYGHGHIPPSSAWRSGARDNLSEPLAQLPAPWAGLDVIARLDVDGR